ncbi:MAG: HEAT repeat domain-containing protein [Pyrinomonadaceae bacterium]|nr:HEAT repeat domain-containing protein [Pyrinomonadaceae bacterium]
MKRFLSTIAFCVFLLIFGLLVLLPSAAAEQNILQNLLNLPAPPPPNPLVRATRRNFSSNSFDREKPPGDDAPIEELLAFWQTQNNSFQEMGYNLKPSEQTLRRILSEITENPEKLPNFLNVLPENSETEDFVKQLYDRQSSGENSEREWDSSIKNWLTYHSRYFSDDLLKIAEAVGDTGEYVSNQKELLALARVDWDKARPLLERLADDNSQPISQTLARWAFYQHAVREKDLSDIDKYRRQLQATVENKSAKPGNRDLAMDALVEAGDFEGRDDWYYSLLEDETLYDLRVNGTTYTGLTTLLNRSPKGKYLAKMLELVGNNNPTIRKAAVRNLTTMLNEKNPEVVRALLPWLENPDWAQEVSGERRRLISALGNLTMPESVPGLIAVLNEKETRQTMSSMGNSMANMMAAANKMSMSANMSRSTSGGSEEYFPYRDEAVNALAKQKDGRAIMPLRGLLPQVEGWQQGNIVRAILASGGFSIPEQVEALELAAKNYNQPDGGAYPGNTAVVMNTMSYEMRGAGVAVDMPPPMMMSNGNYAVVKRPFNPADIKPILATQLINQPEADENLVTALIDRINVLDAKEPQIAFGLRKIMLNWRGAAINAMLMRDVKNNKTDVDSVVKLLSLRKELREKQWNEVSDLRNGGQLAFGLSACLMENPPDYDALLLSENIEAKTAMLACARLIRAALPVRKVAENLSSPNKMLALAAERYLETEDSPAAQSFVLALHPNEAKILGAKKLFKPDDAPATNSIFLPALFASISDSFGLPAYYFYEHSDAFAADEKKLQKEVKENQELLGVYAFDDNFIRIYKDKAVFSWQTDKARFRERDLTKEEFDGFKNYLTAERVSEMPPFLADCEENCEEKELLMLGRSGGRRIFMMGDTPPKFFAELAATFDRMREPPAKLRYALEKNLAGLEILFEDENLQAETVWKNAGDFRVLISDAARREQIDKELERQNADEEKEDVDYEQIWKVRQKRRAQREFENFAWYRVESGKLAGLTDQPATIEFVPRFDGAAVLAEKGQWKARTATFEIRADAEGLYKIAGGRTIKIGDGYYDKPLVTPNGRWVIATKFDGEEGPKLVRVNLLTKKEFPVATEDYPQFTAVAAVTSINKILIFGGGYESEEEEETEAAAQRRGEFYLLDAETGAMNKPKGEIRPLAQQTFRPLQPTGKPDEFWAAIPDAEKNETNVGTFNAKTLVFKSILRVPQIEFGSMQMWIDADKIYFVYQGHLLSLPLQPKNVPPVTN